MTTVIAPFQREAYRAPATLPQTALGALFVVTGGPVLAVVLGRVTTVLGASASLVRFVADPTIGADSDLSLAAGTSISGFAVGRWIWHFSAASAVQVSPGASATELPRTAAGGGPLFTGALVAPGNISLDTTDNQTGEMEWFCYWQPLVPGAVVTAAP